MMSILITLLLGLVQTGWYDLANKQYYEKPNYQKIREAIMTNYNADGWPSDS